MATVGSLFSTDNPENLFFLVVGSILTFFVFWIPAIWLLSLSATAIRFLRSEPPRSLSAMLFILGLPTALTVGVATYTDKTLCEPRLLSLKSMFDRCSTHGGELVGIIIVALGLGMFVWGFLWQDRVRSEYDYRAE